MEKSVAYMGLSGYPPPRWEQTRGRLQQRWGRRTARPSAGTRRRSLYSHHYCY